MENNEKVYASQQLICMLPPLALKVLMYMINLQKYDNIKYYESQMTKFMHISKEELELGIQTLIDNKLIDVCSIDGFFCFNLCKDRIKKYYEVPMQIVKDHDGLQLSKAITWNEVDTNTKSNSVDVDNMSEADLQRMILSLQARLNERNQVKSIVSNIDNYLSNQLPF